MKKRVSGLFQKPFFHFEGPDDLRFFAEWCALSLATLLLVGVCLINQTFNPLGNIFFDAIQRIRSQVPNQKIIIVSIDDRTLSDLGGWPLSRNVYAQFLQNLADTNNLPKAIGFDILMIDPTPADEELAKQMARHNVVLPAELRHEEVGHSLNIRPPPYLIAKAAKTISHVNVAFDEDGFIRGSSLLVSGIPHFSLAMSGLPSPADDGRANYVRFSLIRPDIGFPTISLSDAIEKNYPLSIFKDAYVLVGSIAPSLGDHYPSIYAGKERSGTPGVVFQASLLNDLLQNKLITSASLAANLLITEMCLIIVLLGILILPPFKEFALTLAILMAIVISSVALLLSKNYWLDPMPVIVAILFIKPIWAWRRMRMIMHFMQERALELQTLDDVSGFTPRPRVLRDAVLQYSNVLDRAIQLAKNRLDSLEKIISDLPEAIFVLNSHRQLLVSNKRFRDLFTNEQFKDHQDIDQLLLSLGYSLKDIEDIIALPVGKNYLNIRVQDGADKKYFVHQVALDIGGLEHHLLVMFVEVTALLQLQAQRDRTLQLLSHDMRTPVASILTLCRKALSLEQESSEVSHSINGITSHSKRLLAMMDDFILSIKADETEYQFSVVLIDALIDQAIYEVRELSMERQMPICLQELNESLFIRAQPRLMERVLMNLLANAIRYGEPGTQIVIRISQKSAANGLPLLICEVINTVGSANDSGQYPPMESRGFGLGLQFIEQVILKHGGTIERQLPSEHLALATVRIELPLA